MTPETRENPPAGAWTIERHGPAIRGWFPHREPLDESRARFMFYSERRNLAPGFGVRLVDPNGRIVKVALA